MGSHRTADRNVMIRRVALDLRTNLGRGHQIHERVQDQEGSHLSEVAQCGG